MKWSLKLGSVAGTKLLVHWTFLLLLAWVFFVHWSAGGGLAAALGGVGLITAIFGCVLLHELGHVLAARGYGIATQDITLLPIGGVARLKRMPEKPAQELWVALAGPAVNLVIAALLFLTAVPLASVSDGPDFLSAGNSFLTRLMLVNLFLVGFNLLPAFPMDGGRVLRALLSMRMGRLRATRLAAGIGQGMAVLFGMIGLFYNPLLLFIALFVFLGAEAEAQAVEVNAAIHDLTVSDAMLRRFRTLSAEDSLGTAAKELLAGSQEDFPVVSNGHIRGLLRRQDLAKGLAQYGLYGRVGDAACAQCQPVKSNEPLEEAMDVLRQGQWASVPVVRDDRLVGLLTQENVSDVILVNSALHGERPREALAGTN